MQICSTDAGTNLFILLLLSNLIVISTNATNQNIITSLPIFQNLRIVLYYISTYFFIVTLSLILQRQ